MKLNKESSHLPVYCRAPTWATNHLLLFCGAQGSHHTWAAAPDAAKSLRLCPTLWDPIDGRPPGSPVPGILQARTLEWVAISFSSAWKWKVKVKSLSRVRLLATPWTAAHQVPPSLGFSRQEYWSRVPLPSLITPEHHQLIFCAKAGALRPHVKWSLVKQTDVSGPALRDNQKSERRKTHFILANISQVFNMIFFMGFNVVFCCTTNHLKTYCLIISWYLCSMLWKGAQLHWNPSIYSLN